jgi:cellulose synthase/poly-beta-1,6-N-acetylglucosamine synthase-like glycosyltransferase
MRTGDTLAVVVIGRNEGKRLVACLDALIGQVDRIIYVDSGSTDGSQQAARDREAEVVSLDMVKPFTAARARNAGLDRLRDGGDPPTYVQFLDGDCVLQLGWIPTARAFLDANPKVAVVCGRRRERFPHLSIYNCLIDAEWDTPVGRARSCGGDALMRVAALADVGGYNPNLIAGEEPELCVRLRAAGWEVWRLDAEMTLHDAALSRFGQWWQRTRRGGYAFAEGVALHGAPPERHCVPELRRVVLWGIILPLVTVLGALVSPWALLLLLAWPAQVVRLRLRGMPWYQALFLTLTKLPEALGVLTYWWRSTIRMRARLIEYK